MKKTMTELWKMYLFMLKKIKKIKLLQAIIARTEKASGLFTGQQASKSAGYS